MESSKISALLFLFMLFLSSATPILGCPSCTTPKSPGLLPPLPSLPVPNLPPVTVPTLPLPLPPSTVPNIQVPPVTAPKVPFLPVPVPPVVIGGGGGGGGGSPKGAKPCPPSTSPTSDKCPIDTLKLGACVELLGGLLHGGLGDPTVNKCCPVLQGLAEIEAAACLCTTIKVKALNLKVYVPVAFQLLISCGKSPPPGYTCSI